MWGYASWQAQKSQKKGAWQKTHQIWWLKDRAPLKKQSLDRISQFYIIFCLTIANDFDRASCGGYLTTSEMPGMRNKYPQVLRIIDVPTTHASAIIVASSNLTILAVKNTPPIWYQEKLKPESLGPGCKIFCWSIQFALYYIYISYKVTCYGGIALSTCEGSGKLARRDIAPQFSPLFWEPCMSCRQRCDRKHAICPGMMFDGWRRHFMLRVACFGLSWVEVFQSASTF